MRNLSRHFKMYKEGHGMNKQNFDLVWTIDSV